MVARGLLLLVLPTLGLVACSEVVLQPSPDGGTPPLSDAGLPDGAAPPIPECAPPLPVAEGLVWVGNLELDTDGTFLATELCVDGWASRTFFVPRFYLDTDEVTEACHGACVDAGTCEPAPGLTPSDPNFPVMFSSRAPAEAFCRFRGGRLPSLPELNRAAQADAFSVAQPALYHHWLQCDQNMFGPEDCDALLDHAYAWPRRAVRSYAEDVGPFGHFDLFGASHELTASAFTFAKGPMGSDPYCDLPPDAVAPTLMTSDPNDLITFGPGSIYLSNFSLPAPELPEQREMVRTFYGEPSVPLADKDGLRGVRCAYDVAAP